MKKHDKFFLNGLWVSPDSTQVHEIINPATDEVCAEVPLANEIDCVRAIESAVR